MECGFCGSEEAGGRCGSCARSRETIVGLGAVALEASGRLCQALVRASALQVKCLRDAVEATARVLDVEGVGRSACFEIESLLTRIDERSAAESRMTVGDRRQAIGAAVAETWGYEAAPVTLGGVEVGRFEIPASVLGRTTRRVERHDGAITFTIVEEHRTGRGFVGVWNEADGRLLWAPPEARDLRFYEGYAEVLFDTWRERRRWPTRELVRRTPQRNWKARNIRMTISRERGHIAVLSFEEQDSVTRLSVDGKDCGACSSGGLAPGDVTFSPAETHLVVVLPGLDRWYEREQPEQTEFGSCAIHVCDWRYDRSYTECFYTELPDGLSKDAIGDASVPEPAVFVSELEVEIRPPFCPPRRHLLQGEYLGPPSERPNRPRWVPRTEPRPRVRTSRWQVIGDFGRRLLDVELDMPESVDFAPIPVVGLARGPGGHIGLTLRPQVGDEPTGLATHSFPFAGAGVSAIWDAEGSLVRELAEPGEMHWLEDDVLLVFHADALEALRWPGFDRLWRIPLVSPLDGAQGPGVAFGLVVAPGKDQAVVTWQRAYVERERAARFGYEIVDLDEPRRQRHGEGLALDWMPGADVRGPAFLPDGRLVSAFGDPLWFWASGDVVRGPGSFASFGDIVVHDPRAGTITRWNIGTKTPADFRAPSWRGLGVLGAPKVSEDGGPVTVDLPTGESWTVALTGDRETRPIPKAGPTPPRPRCRILAGNPTAPAQLEPTFELPYGHTETELWARVVSWSRSRDRIMMTLAPPFEWSATTLVGVWDSRTGDLAEVVLERAAVFSGLRDVYYGLDCWQLTRSTWPPNRAQGMTRGVRNATDLALAPDERVAVVVSSGDTRIHVLDLHSESEWVHHVRRDADFRRPIWSADGRYALIAAIYRGEAGQLSGDLVVIERGTGLVRETEIVRGVMGEREGEGEPEPWMAGRLEVTVDGVVRLAFAGGEVWRRRLEDVAPAGVSTLLPLLLWIPEASGPDATVNGQVPWGRLEMLGVASENGPQPLFQGSAVGLRLDEELDDDEIAEQEATDEEELATVRAIFESEGPPWHLGPGALVSLPILAATVAEPELRLRKPLIELLTYVVQVAQATDDHLTLEAVAASRRWLSAGAATSRALGKLLTAR